MESTLAFLKTIKPGGSCFLAGANGKFYVPVPWLALFVIAVLVVASPVMPAATLLHHWTFDDSPENTAVDSVGGLNLTLSGSATLSTTQSVQGGQALNIGAQNSAAFTASTTLPGSFTLAGWVYAGTHNDLQSIVHNAGTGGTTNGFRTLISAVSSAPSVLNLSTGNGTATDLANSTNSAVSVNTWTHFAYVVDRANGTATIYANGVNVSSDSSIRNDFTLTGALYFGQFAGASSNYWLRGYLDDVQIYNGLLTSQEVLFLSQNAGSVVPEPYVSGLLFMGSLGLLLRRRR